MTDGQTDRYADKNTLSGLMVDLRHILMSSCLLDLQFHYDPKHVSRHVHDVCVYVYLKTVPLFPQTLTHVLRTHRMLKQDQIGRPTHTGTDGGGGGGGERERGRQGGRGGGEAPILLSHRFLEAPPLSPH